MALALHDSADQKSGLGLKRRLVRIVEEQSLLRDRTVTLASGAPSGFYFDMKPTLFHPEGISIIAQCMLEKVVADHARFVGGLEMGAIPIVSGITQLSWLNSTIGVHGFVVRKSVKAHGTRKLVEGLPEGSSLNGQRAVVVDDVTTTGGSVLQAVRAARSAGAVVQTVVTVVDRLEGATQNLAQEGIRLLALTTAADYGIGA